MVSQVFIEHPIAYRLERVALFEFLVQCRDNVLQCGRVLDTIVDVTTVADKDVLKQCNEIVGVHLSFELGKR